MMRVSLRYEVLIDKPYVSLLNQDDNLGMALRLDLAYSVIGSHNASMGYVHRINQTSRDGHHYKRSSR
jgi:hypothetical protein